MGAEGGIRIYDEEVLDKLKLWEYLDWFVEVRRQTIFGRRIVHTYYGDNIYPYSGWNGGEHTWGCKEGKEECECRIRAPFSEEEALQALEPAFIDDWEVWT